MLKQANLIVMLITERLIIRPAIIEDAQDLLGLLSNSLVMTQSCDQIYKDMGEIQNLILLKLARQFSAMKLGRFVVKLKDGTFIGQCGLEYDENTKEIDLGYRFLPNFWGKGYATESVNCILSYGFNELGYKKILAKVNPGNISSIKILQKSGFQFNGLIKESGSSVTFLNYYLNSKKIIS